MAMTLRLNDEVNDSLRDRAAFEQRSMQDLVSDAVVEYIERHSREDLLNQVLDAELPRYSDALRRLGE